MKEHQAANTVSRSQGLLPAALFAVAAMVLLAGVLHHELWLDEAHHWIVSRDSGSLAALWDNLRYEGHPVLWNLLLWGVAGVSGAPLAMQLLHTGVILGAMVLLIFRGPFPIWMKVVLPFGYFFLFEYGMLSRNYALGILLAFAYCVAYAERRTLWMGITLALLANTHLLGVWLAGLLVLVTIVQQRERRNGENAEVFSLNIVLPLFTVGAALAVWQIIPPEGHPQMTQWTDRLSPSWGWVNRWLLVFWESMAPVPNMQAYHFWNTNWATITYPTAAKIGGFFFMLLPAWFFRRRPALLILPYGMAVGVFMLQLFLGKSYARHLGYLYLALLVALWLLQAAYRRQDYARGWPALVLALLFSLQLVAGIWAFHMDWKLPFSEAKRTALFLRERVGQGVVLTAEYCFGESLNAYLQEPLFYPEQAGKRFCEWQVFDAPYLADRGEGRFFRQLAEFLESRPPGQVILVHYEPLQAERRPVTLPNGEQRILVTRPLRHFENAIKRMENYYIYQVVWEQSAQQRKE